MWGGGEVRYPSIGHDLLDWFATQFAKCLAEAICYIQLNVRHLKFLVRMSSDLVMSVCVCHTQDRFYYLDR